MIPLAVSFTSSCLGIKVYELEFPHLQSIVTIAPYASYWSHNPSVILRITATNPDSTAKYFGHFISIDSQARLDLMIDTTGQCSGTYHRANVSVFDLNKQLDINIGYEITFELYGSIFNHFC